MKLVYGKFSAVCNMKLPFIVWYIISVTKNYILSPPLQSYPDLNLFIHLAIPKITKMGNQIR